MKPSTAKKLERTTTRQQLLLLRKNLINRSQLQQQIAAHLSILLEQQRQINSIGAYFAIRGEFDPLVVLKHWLQQSAQSSLFLPRTETATRDMQFCRWYPDSEMQQDQYGISYPVGTETAVPQLLLVPCVGYDSRGYRLGYGAGYYDRFLAKQQPQPLTVGIAFAATQLDKFTPNAYDQPLDAILTEHGLMPVSNRLSAQASNLA